MFQKQYFNCCSRNKNSFIHIQYNIYNTFMKYKCKVSTKKKMDYVGCQILPKQM